MKTLRPVKTGQSCAIDLETRGHWRGGSILRQFLKSAVALALSAAAGAIGSVTPALAQEAFPFGEELTLDAAPMRGSKRIPSLDIRSDGAVTVELWCKGARGQFAVANDTVIFAPGPVDDRNCPADRAAADDELLAALADAATWRRQGDVLVLAGSRQLRFRLNAN